MTRYGWIIVTLGAAVVVLLAAFMFLLVRQTAPAPEASSPSSNVAAAHPATAAAPENPSTPAEAGKDEPEAGQALATGRPGRVGECAMTNVKWVGFRLESGDGVPVPDSSSAITLANDVYGVSYERIPEVDASRVGDPVRTCLVSLPQDCPPGDDRGRLYRTTNQRTGQSWTLPDSQHMCGGA